MSGDLAPIVFVVDDDASVREGLQSLLRSVGLRVETFSTAKAFLDHGLPNHPSCVIVDIRMPDLSGLDLQRAMAERGARIPIIFITGHIDVRATVQAMKAGAVEFLTKPFREQELLDAVREAIGRDRTERRLQNELRELRRLFESLTPREREVMALVTRGLLNKQVAAELGTSEITVKVHRAQAMKKMHVQSLAELVRIAQRLGVNEKSNDR